MPKDNCLQQSNQSPVAFHDDFWTLSGNRKLAGLDIAVTGKQNRYAL